MRILLNNQSQSRSLKNTSTPICHPNDWRIKNLMVSLLKMISLCQMWITQCTTDKWGNRPSECEGMGVITNKNSAKPLPYDISTSVRDTFLESGAWLLL